MRDKRRNYIVVGTFVLVVVVALVVSIALLTGRTGATDTYTTRFDDVGGLKFGTQVLYQGFQVGQVESIEPAEGDKRFRVVLAVKQGWPIDREAVVRIDASGLISAVVLDIHGGGSPELLPPGSEIASREHADVFAVLSEVAGELTDLLDEAVRPVLETVGREVPTLLTAVSELAQKMNEAGDRVNALLAPVNVERVGSVLRNTEAVSGDLAALTADLGETRQRLDRVMDTLEGLVAESRGDVSQAVRDLQYSLESVARRIDAVTDNLDATSRNMNEFSRQIRGNPALLLRGGAPPDDADGGGMPE